MNSNRPVSATNSTAEIVGRWVKSAAHDDRTQRRKELRYPFLRAATISRGGLEIKGMCRDISPRGIGLLHSECSIRNGEATVSVWLQDRVIDLVVEITWSKSLSEGWWASGGRLKVSSFQYASLFLSTVRVEIERRYHKRYPFFHSFSVYACSNRTVYGFDNERHQATLHALSLDVSRGGISLMCEDPFEPDGPFVDLRRRRANGDDAKVIRGRIVSCRELVNGFYKIGIEFSSSNLKMVELVGQTRSRTR